MSRNGLIFIVSLGCLCTLAAARADDTSGDPTLKPLQSLDKPQALVERSVLKVADWIDSFFGNNRVYQESQGSYLKISLLRGQEFDTAPVYSSAVRAKLALPKTEDRLKLLIETDPENLDQENQPNTLGDTLESQEQTAAIRFIPFSDSEWRFNTDTGVRYRDGVDAFMRLRLRRLFDFESWSIRAAQSIYTYRSTGNGASTRLEIDWPFTDDWLFRSASDATWEEETDYVDLRQDFLLYQYVNQDRVIQYQLGARGISEPDVHATNYTIAASLRQRLHSDWLYMELTPRVDFPEERDFEAVKSILLEFEVIFGES